MAARPGGRLAPTGRPPRRRVGEVIAAGAALLTLAVLVLAPPVLLVGYVGTPIPVGLSLSGRLGDEATLRLLSGLVWLAWGQLVVCVAVEACAAVRGTGLPRRVPFGGPTQQLARQLVTAVLLVGSTTAGPTAAPGGLAHRPPPATAALASLTGVTGPAAELSTLDPVATQLGRADPAAPPSVPLPEPVAPATAEQHLFDEQAVGHRSAEQRGVDEVARGTGAPVHVVSAPAGRFHDTLWEIAERHLGDGRRWRQIFELNRGLVQPGGARLDRPDLVYPGWRLLLPADAHRDAGGDSNPGPPGPAAGAPPPAAPPSRPAAAGPAPRDAAREPAVRPTSREPANRTDRHRRPGGIELPTGGFVGGTLAASISAALVLARIQRRRRYRPGRLPDGGQTTAEPPLPPVVRTLRRAHLRASSGFAARPSSADDTADITYREGGDRASHRTTAGPPAATRSGAAEAPTAAAVPPPRPGQPIDDGPSAPLAAAAADREPATRPPVVALGIRDGREVCLELAELSGLVLTGPGVQACARALLVGLLSAGARGESEEQIELILPDEDARRLLPDWARADLAPLPRLTITPTLEAALSTLETEILHRRRLADDADRPPSSRAGDPHLPLAAQPATVLLATPQPTTMGRLSAVLDLGGELGISAVLLNAPGPGATCHVERDGHVTATGGSTGGRLDGARLFHLDQADTLALASVLRAAADPDTDADGWASDGAEWTDKGAADRPAQAAGAGTPPSAAAAAEGMHPPDPATAARGYPLQSVPEGPPGRPDPVPAGDVAPATGTASGGTAPAGTSVTRGARSVDLLVLGPARILAGGAEVHGGLRKARELAALLALHPEGASGEAIGEALCPEADPQQAAAQRTLALRKLRDLLRTATGLGEPMFITRSGERYRLDPTLIDADLWRFEHALTQARRLDGAARLAALEQAVALYRGELVCGADYEWVEPYREAVRRRALDAFTRIAEAQQAHDVEQALATLEQALGHDPYNEGLYQRIMRLQARLHRPDAVRRTLRLLETRLSELGVPPGGETRRVAAAVLNVTAPPAESDRPARGGDPLSS